MKIALFSDTYFPQINGVSYTISLWKDRLKKRGHDVKLFYPDSSYESKKDEIEVKSVSLPFYDGYKVGLPSRLRNYLEDVDVIHTHSPFSLGVLGAYYSSKLDIPRVNTHHTSIEEYINYFPGNSFLKPFLIKIYRFWEQKFMNSSDLVTTPSESIKEILNDKGIRDVFVLENGVNQEFFRPKEKTFKDEFGSKYLVGYCGRHSREKNLDDLIEFAKGKERFEVLLAGDGPYKKKYKKRAKSIDNVHFLGFLDREKLPHFYSSLDVFVFPSEAETQGLVALEANSCGTPVVASREKALKETIIDGVNGYNYEKNNINDLDKKIQKVILNEKELSEKSLKHSCSHSVENTIDELVNQYKRICVKNETKKLYD